MEAASSSDSSVEIVTYRNIERGDSPSPDGDTSSTESKDSAIESLILLAIESPNLSALITAFNATATLNAVFANHGEDIKKEIEYDPEWYRKMPTIAERGESNEKEWQESVRVELQLLSAFLDGKFQRLSASTGNLESLFRMKVSRAEEAELEVSTIFKIVVDIPEIKRSIMQYVNVDSEDVPVLPIPVESENYKGSLQGALDRVFWPYTVGGSSEQVEDINQIPVLKNICNVLIIQCQQTGIDLDDKIWPERYTQEYRECVFQKWSARREREEQVQELTERLKAKSTCSSGASVPEALEITLESLSNTGHDAAAQEIRTQLKLLNQEISDIQAELNRFQLEQEISDDASNVVPIDPSKMTPYVLRAIVWTEFTANDPVVVTRYWEDSNEWSYTHGTESCLLTTPDVIRFARKTDNYMVIYERQQPTASRSIAPSIQEFVRKEEEEPPSTEPSVASNSETQHTDQTQYTISESSSIVSATSVNTRESLRETTTQVDSPVD